MHLSPHLIEFTLLPLRGTSHSHIALTEPIVHELCIGKYRRDLLISTQYA